ncbi:hypothetical protein SCP_0201350 [Sparassis crispa]|uniref:AC transposase n=1 Tax=Sparassis crispa TaxID=139825 RepID=A0A401G9U9_9APHY|nr:hypothetical protein SCP_0201350 [Sparassis crispa]GBE78938.1 hypothetical protein SCP_0201350 [Sparassis crispa]
MAKRRATQSDRSSQKKKRGEVEDAPTAQLTHDRCARVEDVEDEGEVLNTRVGLEDEIIDIDAPSGSSSRSTAKTPEEQLCEAQEDWTSPAYAFYKPDVTIQVDEKMHAHAYIFHCVNRGCKMKIARWTDKGDKSSMGNLRKHIRKCWGEEALAAADMMKTADDARPAVEKFARSGSITASFERKGKGKITYSVRQHTRTESRAEIVRWVSESLRPFAIVEDHGFQNLMKTGRPEYWIPSRWTVAQDVHKVFVRCRTRVARMLQEFDGELNFATDAWMSPNNKALVAFTVHLHHQGVLLRMMLDVIEIADSHNGVNLAAVFAKMVDDFNIAIKLLGVTADNASSNDTMIDELAELLEGFQGQANRSRCFDHVVNLVAKSLLRQFDLPKGKADDVLDDAERALLELAKDLNMDVPKGDDEEEDRADNIEGLEDERDGLSPEEIQELEESVQPVKLVLVKTGIQLQKIACTIICSSTKLLPIWLKIVATFKMAENKMPRDVATRWNSTFKMLVFALEYRKPIDSICEDRSTELHKFEMSNEEWTIAEQLRDILRLSHRMSLSLIPRHLPLLADLQRRDIVFLALDPFATYGHPGDGHNR